MNKKKYIINSIILLIVTGLTFYYLLKDDGVNKIKSLANLNIVHALILFLLITSIFILEGLIIKIANNGIVEKFKFSDGVNAYVCGQLGSNISPYKTMHYPCLFYYFNKKGMCFEDSMANVSKCSIVYGISTTFLYTIFFIIAHIRQLTIDINGYTFYIEIATLVGWVVNFLQILMHITLAYSKRIHDLYIKFSFAILKKFKKVSDKEEYNKKEKVKMEIFKKEIQYFLTHIKDLFFMTLLYLTRILVAGTLTYIIYLLLTRKSFSISQMLIFFILYQTSTYIANLTPAPGGSGGIEFSFTLVYSALIEKEYLLSVLIIYRSVTYIVPLIFEAIVFAIIVNKNKIINNEKKVEI